MSSDSSPRSALGWTASLVLHAPQIIESFDDLPEESLKRFLMLSRERFAAWHACFNRRQNPAGPRYVHSADFFTEILLTDFTTRLACAFWSAIDVHHRQKFALPIAEYIFGHQLFWRSQALKELSLGRGLVQGQIVALNCLLKRVDRWTDMLLGTLLDRFPVGRFVISPEVAEDSRFSHQHHSAATFVHAESLILAGIQRSIPEYPVDCPIRRRWIDDFIRLHLALCPPSHFSDSGVRRCITRQRIHLGATHPESPLHSKTHKPAPLPKLEPGPDSLPAQPEPPPDQNPPLPPRFSTEW